VPATPPAIRAAKLAAGTVPIVFPLGSDPVETGLVSSLDRPGRNITGMATMSREQSEPRMAFVRQLMPAARHIALMRHSPNAALDLQVDASRQAAPEQGFEIVVLDFATAEEIEQATPRLRASTRRCTVPVATLAALAAARRAASATGSYR
jgi:putative ABC transport system substrate-binding protein